MDRALKTTLSKKANLKRLQNHYQKSMILPLGPPTGLFALLLANNSSIGHVQGKKLHLSVTAWSAIRDLVKREVGFDLLLDSLESLSLQDRVNTSLSMNDEKILSLPPMSGFLMCRIIGDSYDVSASTARFVSGPTPENSYFGIQATQLDKWDFDVLLVVENFAAFIAIDQNYLKGVNARGVAQTVVVVYRGSDHQNIYSVSETLKDIDAERYVYADYDLSGLSLAATIAEKINATGYVLPDLDVSGGQLAALTKKEVRFAQSAVTITDPVLMPYYQDIKTNFLSVTQESLIANKVKMKVVIR